MDPTIPDPPREPTQEMRPPPADAPGGPAPAAPVPPPGPADTPPPATGRFSDRLDLAAVLVAAVVGLQMLAVLVVVSTGDDFGRSVGDRLRDASRQFEPRFGLLLLSVAILATLPERGLRGAIRPRSDLGRIALILTVAFGGLIAVVGLIGIGLDLSAEPFPDNRGAAVLERLASVLMAVVAAGWALTALGVRIITTRSGP